MSWLLIDLLVSGSVTTVSVFVVISQFKNRKTTTITQARSSDPDEQRQPWNQTTILFSNSSLKRNVGLRKASFSWINLWAHREKKYIFHKPHRRRSSGTKREGTWFPSQMEYCVTPVWNFVKYVCFLRTEYIIYLYYSHRDSKEFFFFSWEPHETLKTSCFFIYFPSELQ